VGVWLSPAGLPVRKPLRTLVQALRYLGSASFGLNGQVDQFGKLHDLLRIHFWMYIPVHPFLDAAKFGYPGVYAACQHPRSSLKPPAGLLHLVTRNNLTLSLVPLPTSPTSSSCATSSNAQR
jgi:hypothetical protein